MLKPFVRSLAFLSNWVAWVIRQPSMLLTMIIGPFIILGLFALADATQAPRAETIIVRPPDADPETQIPTETLELYFDVVAETEDAGWARQQLEGRRVNVVLLLPPDPAERVAAGEQADIVVLTNEIDPIAVTFLDADMRAQIAELNYEVQRKGIERTKAEAAATERDLAASEARLDRVDDSAEDPQAVRREVRELDEELTPVLDRVPALTVAARTATLLLPPEEVAPALAEVEHAERTALEARATLVALRAEAESPQPDPDRIRELSRTLRGQLAALREQMGAVEDIPTVPLVQPFVGRLEQAVPYRPTLVTFYASAALALLLQHFAVTLAALSMVRARLLGMVEFWRIAPIRAGEVIGGNYLSYGLLSLFAWAVLNAAVVFLLDVPVLGSAYNLVGAAALLILASLGIGFVISLLATDEQQAAQLAMLVLLGSVFLSGFVRPLEAIDFPVRLASYLLPATFGIQLFQDIMLRGLEGDLWHMLALATLGVAGLFVSLSLFRRELRPT